METIIEDIIISIFEMKKLKLKIVYKSLKISCVVINQSSGLYYTKAPFF